MNCTPEMTALMHKVLDEEADEKEKARLQLHLSECGPCRQHFDELRKAVAAVQSTAGVSAPKGFKAHVMQRLPKESRTAAVKRWFRMHPALTAAAMFFVFMTGFLFAEWGAPQEVSVLGEGDVKQRNGVVIVPEGEVIKGDLVVRNSDVRIHGEVHGDVTVINGEKYLASPGQVTGEIEVVDETLEWIWYQIKHLFAGF